MNLLQPGQGSSRHRLVTFALADSVCALRLGDIREILPTAELSRPPGLPALLEGLLNLGGVVLPVVNLRRLFGLNELAPALYGHLIVLQSSTAQLAFLVDYVQDVVELAAAELHPVEPGRSINACVEAEVSYAGRTVHLMTAQKLLLAEEHARIAELCAREQERLQLLQEHPA
jgi:purine-binding chemotaxis protein CheW